MRKKKRQNPPPVSTQIYKAPDPLPTSTILVVKGINQAICLCRFIITRNIRDADSLTEHDFYAMWQLIEYFERQKFNDIYKEKVEILSSCVFTLKELVKLEKRLPLSFEVARLRHLLPLVEMDPREYLGRFNDNTLKTEKFLKLINPNKVRKEKERRFIGVGYRDKGTTVLPSQNGSPNWKDLSRSLMDYDVETYYLAKKYVYSDWPKYLIPPEVYTRVQKLSQPIFAELELIHSPASPRPYHGRYFYHTGETLIRRSS